MTTYYVRKTGSDAAAGTSAGAAWLTIDKAANTVAAGDIVYVGAGTYRELVTMDVSGSAGSVIKFIADVDGSQTGDAGLVVISAFTDSRTSARTSCWDPDGRTFVEVYDFVMQGGTSAVVYSANATHDNYEGVVFDGCVFVSGPAASSSDFGLDVDMNQATTPTNAGLTVRNCVFYGAGVRVRWDQNATAQQNLKVTVENCLMVGDTASHPNGSGVFWNLITASTYGSGGCSINNCTIIGYGFGVYVDHGASTTYPVAVRNCLIRCVDTLSKATSNDGALTSDYNMHVGGQTNVSLGPNDTDETTSGLLGGIADLPLLRKWGWSPYRPWEPMRPPGDDGWTALVGAGSASFAPATDFYGNPRPMGRGGVATADYYFDASDAAASDPDAAWTNDANAFDGSTATTATTTTSGTETTFELRAEGTNAPASGGTILKVEYRVFTGTVGSQRWAIYADGGTEGLAGPSSTSVSNAWTMWQTVVAPSGGWTWAKVQALEVVLWASTQPGAVGVVQVKVFYTPDGPADDIGAVQRRARLEPETTTKRTGSTAGRFDGAGRHTYTLPVAAASTTVSVYARKDSNYAGTAPQLKVSRIPGVADQTDTHTAAADTWEQLTVTFTPTAAGVAVVELISNDTSTTGKAFFDDFTVT